MKTLNDYLKEVGLDPKTASWDCRGKTVVLHKALEVLAHAKRIEFANPEFIHMDVASGNIAIKVSGFMELPEKDTDGQPKLMKQWAFGEINTKNHSTSYPFAVVEKRAKDRVILKLLGIHGEVYSESEAEDFKKPIKKDYSRIDAKMDAPRAPAIDDNF